MLRMHISEKIIIPLSVMFRFFPTVMDEAASISAAMRMRDIRFGSVFQNPRSQFFCVDTTSEIAFGCENMGMPEAEIQSRVDRVTEELHIEPLLGRSIFELSGGEKQKIACASVSALQPQIMVLDEPTSNLDMTAIEDLRRIILNWKSQGKTVVIAQSTGCTG